MFKPIFSKVAGVTKENFDGVLRQDILLDCEVGDELFLERDDLCEHDHNAIIVDSLYGQIGYIKKELAAKLAPIMDAGMEFYCEITDLTGGTPDKPTMGCNIKIQPKNIRRQTEDPFTSIVVTVPKAETATSEPKKKITFWGAIGALLKFVLLLIAGLVIVIVVIGFIKGW